MRIRQRIGQLVDTPLKGSYDQADGLSLTQAMRIGDAPIPRQRVVTRRTCVLDRQLPEGAGLQGRHGSQALDPRLTKNFSEQGLQKARVVTRLAVARSVPFKTDP